MVHSVNLYDMISIVACVEVGDPRIFKSMLVSKLNMGNQLYLKVDKLILGLAYYIRFMKPSLLIIVNHDTILNLGYDCSV